MSDDPTPRFAVPDPSRSAAPDPSRSSAPNPSSALATVVADELVRGGVTDVVLAPGSRSAALAMALHAEQRLRLHVEVDERSAGYLAVGIGRASGRPAAVVVTSGSAVANLHPAVVEADTGAVPLLLLTADRPPELRDTGANQAIDQLHLFGRAVRWFHEMGPADDTPGAVAHWRSVVARGVAEASGLRGPAGPVHLNLPFREPTVPLSDDGRHRAAPFAADLAGRPDTDAAGTGASGTDASGAGAAGTGADGAVSAAPSTAGGSPGAGAGAPWVAVRRAPRRLDDETLDALAEQIAATPRGLVVVGQTDTDPEPVLALARAAGWPVIAEPTSNARRPGALAHAHHVLGHAAFARVHRPDLVLRIGRSGLSRNLVRLLAADVPQWLLDADGGWHDPERTIARLVVADAALTCAALADRLVSSVPVADDGGAWAAAWHAADRAVATALDAVLDADEAPSEPQVARDLAAALPDGTTLVVGSSMPVRDLDLVLRPREGLRVLANRGASGIDGVVSTALGAAIVDAVAGGRPPTVALLGDLTLLHDANGFLLSPELPDGVERLDAVFVVVDNDGGGIFSFLPQIGFPEAFERVFGTPHGRDLGRLAAFHDLGYTRVDRAADLAPAVLDAAHAGGLHLVHVRTDRAANLALHQRLTAVTADALDHLADTW